MRAPQDIGYQLLPDHLRKGMRLYVEAGILPGDFLQAVLRNDFVDAVGRADGESLFALPLIACFLHQEMPAAAWGSREKVEAWSLAAKARAGAAS